MLCGREGGREEGGGRGEGEGGGGEREEGKGKERGMNMKGGRGGGRGKFAEEARDEQRRQDHYHPHFTAPQITLLHFTPSFAHTTRSCGCHHTTLVS